MAYDYEYKDDEPMPALTLEEKVRTLQAVTAGYLQRIPPKPGGAHEAQIVFSAEEEGLVMANGKGIFRARSTPPLQSGPQLTVADAQHARDQLDFPQIGHLTVQGASQRTVHDRMAPPWQTRKERD